MLRMCSFTYTISNEWEWPNVRNRLWRHPTRIILSACKKKYLYTTLLYITFVFVYPEIGLFFLQHFQRNDFWINIFVSCKIAQETWRFNEWKVSIFFWMMYHLIVQKVICLLCEKNQNIRFVFICKLNRTTEKTGYSRFYTNTHTNTARVCCMYRFVACVCKWGPP